jgi:hypothetical protein
LLAEVKDSDVGMEEDPNEDIVREDSVSVKNKLLFNFSTDLTNNGLVVLVSVLAGFSKNDFYVRLYSLFGRETILFLSMFNGAAVKVPDIRYLLKLKKFSMVYLYLKEGDFTERTYLGASKKFHKSVEDLKKISDKVDTCMKQFRELFQANNKETEDFPDVKEEQPESDGLVGVV